MDTTTASARPGTEPLTKEVFLQKYVLNKTRRGGGNCGLSVARQAAMAWDEIQKALNAQRA